MPINIGLTSKSQNKLLEHNAEYDVVSNVRALVDISYVFSGCAWYIMTSREL